MLKSKISLNLIELTKLNTFDRIEGKTAIKFFELKITSKLSLLQKKLSFTRKQFAHEQAM